MKHDETGLDRTQSSSSCDTDEEDTLIIPPLMYRSNRRVHLSKTDYIEADDGESFVYSERLPLIQKDLFPTKKPWWADDDSVSTKDSGPKMNISQVLISLTLVHFSFMAVFDILSNPPWISTYGLFLNPLVGPGESTLYRFGLLDSSQPFRCISNLLICANIPQLLLNVSVLNYLIKIEKEWSMERTLSILTVSSLSQCLPSLFDQVGCGGNVFPLAILSAHCVECIMEERGWKSSSLMILILICMGVTPYMNLWIQISGFLIGICFGLYWVIHSSKDKKQYLSPILGKSYDNLNPSTKKIRIGLFLSILACCFVAYPILVQAPNCEVRHILLGSECMQTCIYSKNLSEGECGNFGYECISVSGRDVEVYDQVCGDIKYFGIGRLAVEDIY